MEEIWKDIAGYENYYMVSNFGRVKGVKRKVNSNNGTITLKEKIISSRVGKLGYVQISLTKENKISFHLVHRLVAFAFIDNPYRKKTVNHKNGIKTDNSVSNLEWMTLSENISHAYRIGIKTAPILGIRGEENKNSVRVLQFSSDGIFIKEWGSIVDAANALNLFPTSISRACMGKSKTTGGYIWKHK